ncbi:MAG: hypothetical protein ABT940_10115 [Alphaproteobacteria bacterium]
MTTRMFIANVGRKIELWEAFESPREAAVWIILALLLLMLAVAAPELGAGVG